MQVIITNADEAGMPETMAGHCQQLLAWRIAKLYDQNLPAEGDNIHVLYSEKDPLLESEEVDDQAYFVYFGVSKVEPGENATVYVELAY